MKIQEGKKQKEKHEEKIWQNEKHDEEKLERKTRLSWGFPKTTGQSGKSTK